MEHFGTRYQIKKYFKGVASSFVFWLFYNALFMMIGYFTVYTYNQIIGTPLVESEAIISGQIKVATFITVVSSFILST